ncbi:C-terminal binding protein [Azohydromonas australica]|uniref:C-terminal binding protein n=1 Tax=Azohydromonas australica TaxID=364039 RepID=UPI000425EB8E|nr:C-terminal binding protein [Azohydromonas australica]
MTASTVLVTDFAWPDLDIERDVLEGAGLRLVAGPASPAPADTIAALVREHQPSSILTCWAQVNAQAVNASSRLQHVGRIGVGLDNIDVAACTARGLPVTNVPDYCVEEVSDHAVGFALAWTRGLVAFDRDVHAGRWDPAKARLRRLSALTVGLVGYGRIGQASARKFAAFGCRVLANTLTPPARSTGVEFTELDTLLTQSDIVVLHLPLTPESHHLINRSRINAMKPGALLVNVSRGGIVDTDAVVEALASGHLGGAALDVIESEPQVPAALLAQPGALLTPHVAFSSDASLAELRRRAAEETVRVLSGRAPLNRCN